MNRKTMIAVLLLFQLLFFLTACDDDSDSNTSFEQKDALTLYKETVATQKYIIHALGGDEMDGEKYTYINSVDVLKKWYDKGFRLFEVDLWETSDGELVLLHNSTGPLGDLSKSECTKLGLTYPADPSYAEFMQCKVYGIYSTSSLSDLIQFIHGGGYNMFVMIDCGKRSYSDTKYIYQKIYDSAGGDESVLTHFIAGGQTTQMVDAARNVYEFPILNLYFGTQSARQDILKEQEDFIKYCKRAGITSFSLANTTFDTEDLTVLMNGGLISYPFTTNDSERAALFFENGATCVGTDFLGTEESDD